MSNSFKVIYIQSNEIHNVVALIKFFILPKLLYQLDVSGNASLTTYQSAHTVSTKKLLRMDRYGPKHVELTPKC